MQLISGNTVTKREKRGSYMFKKYFVIIASIFLLSTTSAFADCNGGTSDGCPAGSWRPNLIVNCKPCKGNGQKPPPPPNNPIDGGIGILLALGVGYGIKKLRDKK